MIDIVKREIIGEHEHIQYSNGTVVKLSAHAVDTKEIEQEESTGLELLMQAQADAELRDFAIQQGQELLAQQMADIELAVLGGAV